MKRTVAEGEAPILWPHDVKRRRGGQRMKWLNGIADSMDLSLSKLREIVKRRKLI